MPQPSSHHKFPSLIPLLSLLFITTLCDSNPPRLEFAVEHPHKSIPITTNSPHFNVELSYPKAFDVSIESYNNQEGQTGFCTVFPSRMTEKMVWSGPLPGIRSEDQHGLIDTSEGKIDHDYDNLAYYNKFFFVLDSVSFKITVTSNFADKKSYMTIPSSFPNDMEDGMPEDAYMLIDENMEMLFIVTRKRLIYYDLFYFFDAVHNNKTIPRIVNQVTNFGPYNSLVNVKLHKFRIFIVADNIIDVFLEVMNRTIHKEIRVDNQYFGLPTVFLTGITFRGNFLFVLDKFNGVYLIDVSNVDKIYESDIKAKYWFQADVRLEVANGQFVEVIDNTLQIISTSSKGPTLHEYFIIGDSRITKYDFNRQVDLYQSVRDTYVDKNYLYLLTGYFNMVTKHAIPGRFQGPVLKDFLSGYWPMFGTKAMVSLPSNSTSKVVALHDDYITAFTVKESNPMLSCSMKGVEEGTYRYRLQAFQKDCAEKAREQNSNYNSVCRITQNIDLVVIKGDANIGHTHQSKKKVMFLAIGVGVLFLLVIIFVGLWRKYKKQFHRLEDEIKFQKLQEEEEESDKETPKKKDSHQLEVEK